MTDLETRLRLLEQHMEIQEAILTALQAERIEADRLTDSVDRLGSNADALGQALLQVDRNQQALTKLGTEISVVKRETVTKAEADKRASELAEFARHGRRNLFWQMAAGLAFLACVILYVNFSFQQYRDTAASVCEARSLQSVKIGLYLDRALANPDIGKLPADRQKEVKEQAQLLREAFPVISCSALR